MQNKIKLMLLFFLNCAIAVLAQQPRWELFSPDLSGPIAVDPTDSDIIYIAGDSCSNCAKIGMWKTTDGGQTWNFYDEGWGMGTPRDILINPDNPQEILVSGGPFVGVVKSADGGQTWIRADNGLRFDHHGFLVYQLAFDRRKGIYYLADQGGGAFCGIYRSSDGVNWQLASPPNFCPLSVIVDEASSHVYIGTDVGDVWKTTDAGSTWVDHGNGLNTDSWVWDLDKLKNSETLYAATFEGIYKTFDGGKNWFSVNDSITSQLDFRGGLEVAEADTNTIFAGAQATLDPARPGGIYISRDGGDSWILYDFGLPDSSLDLHALNLFLDNQTNVLYARIGLLFGESQGEINMYRLSNAVITKVAERHRSVSQAQLALTSYPNPFNTQTTLMYSVPLSGRVTIRIFNILGKKVMRLLDEQMSPGEYSMLWDGRNKEGKGAPSGIYLARIQLGKQAATIKLFILK